MRKINQHDQRLYFLRDKFCPVEFVLYVCACCTAKYKAMKVQLLHFMANCKFLVLRRVTLQSYVCHPCHVATVIAHILKVRREGTQRKREGIKRDRIGAIMQTKFVYTKNEKGKNEQSVANITRSIHFLFRFDVILTYPCERKKWK